MSTIKPLSDPRSRKSCCYSHALHLPSPSSLHAPSPGVAYVLKFSTNHSRGGLY